MVNHRQTTIWENIFGAFSKHLNQIQVGYPSFFGKFMSFSFCGRTFIFQGRSLVFFWGVQDLCSCDGKGRCLKAT